MFVKVQDNSIVNLKNVVKIHIVNSFDYEYLNPNNKYFDDNRDILLEAGFEELELGKHRFSRPYFEVNSLASFASEESSSVSIVLWRSKKEICERILDIIF